MTHSTTALYVEAAEQLRWEASLTDHESDAIRLWAPVVRRRALLIHAAECLERYVNAGRARSEESDTNG